ncbi:MAG: septation protein A [Hyphomicrobiales bacterium]|nr:septation protein A [Hyphomicrobiales bacterium]
MDVTQPAATTPATRKPLIKLATEFGPLLVFFWANSRGEWLVERLANTGLAELVNSLPPQNKPIFIATAVFMIATVISLIVSKTVLKKIPVMPLFNGVLVLVFGALTLYLQDDFFIKIKPTLANLMFASILLTGLYFGRIFLKLVFEEVIKLREEGWRLLTLRWGVFFLCLAVLNEIIWRSFSTDFWVSFKTFGFMPITFIFMMSQISLLTRYQIPEAASAEPTVK